MQEEANASQIVSDCHNSYTFEKQIDTIMAKLVTTKEKYGVSVAARIEPELAYRIAERAESLGVSMAKMVGMLISNGFRSPGPAASESSEEIQTLQTELANVKNLVEQKESLYKRAAADFIYQVSQVEETLKSEYLATIYNEILDQLKNEERTSY